MRHQIDVFSPKGLVACRFRKSQFNASCFIDANTMKGLVVDGVLRRTFEGGNALVSIGELKELKSLFGWVEMHRMLERIGARGFFVEVSKAVMQQKPFHGNTLGRDGGEINLGAFFLVQQNGPVMVIHADDVILHNGAHETEENLTIGCVLHFVLIESLPPVIVKLYGLKLPQFIQRQGVNASMDE